MLRVSPPWRFTLAFASMLAACGGPIDEGGGGTGAADSALIAGRQAGKQVPSSGALLATYCNSNDSNGWTESEVTGRETQLGRKYDIDMRYYAWTEQFPQAADNWDAQNGRIPMISWAGNISGLVASVNAGKQDTWIRAQANRYKNFGHPVFLRLWWEMNGKWMAYNGSHTSDSGTHDGPAKYVAAWRRIWNIFHAAGATNVVWVWSPDVNDAPKETWNHWTAYYPGDTYVDWVAGDGYNRGTAAGGWGWHEFSSIFGPLYNDYQGRKPFMVAETGSVEQGGNKATWLSNMASSIRSNMPDVAALLYWDANDHQVVGDDFRISTSSSALSAFKSLANSTYFKTR